MVGKTFGAQIQIELYGKDSVEHFKRSKQIEKYIARKAVQNENTATTYKSYLTSFANFVFVKYKKKDVDDLIEDVKQGKYNPYDVLAELAAFLKNERKEKIANNSIRFITVATRKFMRFSGIPIAIEDFKGFVSLPKKEHADLDAIDKHDIIDILNACKQPRLKTFLIFLGATGARAFEAASVKMQDLTLDDKVPTVVFRSESTKTRVKRTCYLTTELASQLRVWIKQKYQPHRTTFHKGGKEYQEFVTPEPKPDDLVFGFWHTDESNPDPKNVYNKMREYFAELLGVIGKDKLHYNGRHRTITLHSFRRFAKTTISDQGFADFSEYFIGHAGSTYWRKKDAEKLEIFRRIEPYITFLDAKQLDASTADIKAENEALKTTVLKVKEEVSELKTYKDNFERTVTFLKTIFPEKAEAIDALTKGRN